VVGGPAGSSIIDERQYNGNLRDIGLGGYHACCATAARACCGFATNVEPGQALNHRITEHRHNGRRVGNDSEILGGSEGGNARRLPAGGWNLDADFRYRGSWAETLAAAQMQVSGN